MKFPFISVIVPVYNAEKTLANCIDSLINQDYPKNRYELILIDNNSTDSSLKIMFRYKRKGIHFFGRKKQGPGAARNTGIKHAKGEIIAFTDSDCTADKNWLKEIAKMFNTGDHAIIGKLKTYHPNNLIEKYIEKCWKYRNDELKTAKETTLNNFTVAATGNCAYLKKDIIKLGSFDENFKIGEDYDLTLRYLLAGKKFRYSEQMVVYHKHRSTFLKYIQQQIRYGYANGRIQKKHQTSKNKSVFFIKCFFIETLRSFLKILKASSFFDIYCIFMDLVTITAVLAGVIKYDFNYIMRRCV